MNKFAVIIRVYNRIQDLEYNLEIIRNTWLHNDYYIIVSSNGENDGYVLTDKIHSLSDMIVRYDGNSGHIKGNSLLLLQAIPLIPKDCEYTLLLESDTWLYEDSLICKYVEKLKDQGAIWASAKWYDKFYSLATDFAIVDTAFLRANNNLLAFGDYPETYVALYINNKKGKYIYIRENMPVLIASYLKKLPYSPFGRFFVFPYSKMVTHHVEYYKNGMQKKKRDFNALSNNYFSECKILFPSAVRLWMKLVVLFSLLFPRRSWWGNVRYVENIFR